MLLLPTLLFVAAALLLAATFQLLLALLLGFALPFGALEGQVGLLHLWWSFNLNGAAALRPVSQPAVRAVLAPAAAG